ncbi:MAG: transposase [Cyanobacteria bacterium J06631_2]
MKNKKKGSSNWRKACKKIARLHEQISNTRKDFHYKLANQLCDDAGMIFAENLNLKAMSRGMLRKHNLDAGFGQFLSILEFVCHKRGVYFEKVDPNYTSQICPRCQTLTGKKLLSERVHSCPECGYTTNRDVAAAQVVMQRGIKSVAVGRTVQASEGIGLRRSL